MSNGTTADGGQKPGTGGGWREVIGLVLFVVVSGFPAAGKAGPLLLRRTRLTVW